jgi:hypothetical protein
LTFAYSNGHSTTALAVAAKYADATTLYYSPPVYGIEEFIVWFFSHIVKNSSKTEN